MTTMNLQLTFQDDSLFIRPLKEDGFDALYNAAKDPLIWEQHTDERYKKDVYETFFHGAIESGRALAIIDKETGKIIGTSRYKRLLESIRQLKPAGRSLPENTGAVLQTKLLKH